MPGNNFWLACHLTLAFIGTIEWFSTGVARRVEHLQQSLANMLATARKEETAARIVDAAGGILGTSSGASLAVAGLLAFATYSGVEMLHSRSSADWERLGDECVFCAATSLALGIWAARWIVSIVPSSHGSLLGALLPLAIRGGLGLGLALAVAAVSGYISFESLGVMRWLGAFFVLLAMLVWCLAFFAAALFDLSPSRIPATDFWQAVQRWAARVFAVVTLGGVALLFAGVLLKSTVSIVDQMILAGVLLPLLAAGLMLLASAAALLLGTLFMGSVSSAERVLRTLQQKKVNVGYTLLGIELFVKEVWAMLPQGAN